MSNLLIILGVLFLALFLVVTLAERFGKPMEPEQMGRLSRILMILVFILIVAQLLRVAFA